MKFRLHRILFAKNNIKDSTRLINLTFKYFYHGKSDTRMHVATSTIDRLLDYCINTPEDGIGVS